MTIVVCTAPSATKKGYLYWATELVRGKNQAAKGDGVTSTNIKCPAAFTRRGMCRRWEDPRRASWNSKGCHSLF